MLIRESGREPRPRRQRMRRPAVTAPIRFLKGILCELPQVRELALDEVDGHPLVMVIIEASPFDFSAREPIFNAEISTAQRFPGSSIEVRIVNREELRRSALADVDLSAHRLLWRREPVLT
jgi:hypothetical protein